MPVWGEDMLVGQVCKVALETHGRQRQSQHWLPSLAPRLGMRPSCTPYQYGVQTSFLALPPRCGSLGALLLDAPSTPSPQVLVPADTATYPTV